MTSRGCGCCRTSSTAIPTRWRSAWRGRSRPRSRETSRSSGSARAGEQRTMTGRFEDRVVITGLGQSELGRRLGRDDLDLTAAACRAAVDDAGLTMGDIDGLASFPGAADISRRSVTGPGLWEVQDMLGLELGWYSAGLEVASQLGAVVTACLAGAGGLARQVLVFRLVTGSTGRGTGRRRGVETTARVTGQNQWLRPFDVVSGANRMALYAQRHMHEYGTTREQLGSIAVTFRRHAAANPAAVYRER